MKRKAINVKKTYIKPEEKVEKLEIQIVLTTSE